MSWERLTAEIERQPKLTAAEEQLLREQYLDGSDKARERLISCTLRYALGHAKALAKQGGRWEPGDLLGEAVQALSSALERWNGSGSFAAYVQPRLRGAMQDFLRRRADVVRAPNGAARALSLDAPDDDSGSTMLDAVSAEEAPPEAANFDDVPLTSRERRVLSLTVLRHPFPGSIKLAAVDLGLSESTVARALRSALRKRAASGAV